VTKRPSDHELASPPCGEVIWLCWWKAHPECNCKVEAKSWFSARCRAEMKLGRSRGEIDAAQESDGPAPWNQIVNNHPVRRLSPLLAMKEEETVARPAEVTIVEANRRKA
jgi:hypothetical protein